MSEQPTVVELRSLADVAAWSSSVRGRQRLTVASLASPRLDKAADEIMETCAGTTGYDRADVRALWDDQHLYLSRLTLAFDATRRGVVFDGTRERSQILQRRPIGNVLICIPSNAPIPLIAMLAATALTAGNTCVLAGPRQLAPLTRQILACFDGIPGLAHFTDSPKTIVAEGLELFDHVYFMGGSAAYPSIAAACAKAGTSLTFEGQGNGLVYIGPTARESLTQSTKLLLEAKRFCNGRMCSAPNSIMVHQELHDEFIETWTELSPTFELNFPIDQVISDDTAAWLEQHALIGDVEESRPILCGVREPMQLPSWELYAPVAAICQVISYDEAERYLAANRYRLQASYFGCAPDEVERFKRLNYARLCININPADQDPVAPWGNYGFSGHSPVETFLDKLTRRQLVEVGT